MKRCTSSLDSAVPSGVGSTWFRPKIVFFGDPHGNFEPIVRAVDEFRPEAIILLGDLQPRRPLHIELAPILNSTDIWFIHGNHDTDSDADYDNVWGSDLADRNLHVRVQQIAGFEVCGLGGIFRDGIWDARMPRSDARLQSAEELRERMTIGGPDVDELWRDGISRRHRSSIFPVDYLRVFGLRADILVTHEAPSAHGLGWKVIDELAVSLGAGLLVHGHHHEDIDYLAEGRITPDSPFLIYGVGQGSHLAWPRRSE
jgi:hypothetical protein